jgi:glycosyltransferase involved in cell wall biosynthesis
VKLEFECTAEECGSEATYRRLIAHLDQRALGVLQRAPGRLGRRFGIFGAAARYRDPQTIAILKSGLFDADLYLSTYKDVGAAGADPLRHYIESGDEEGRWPNAFFDPTFYRKQFTATGRWPFSTLHHYATVGEAAGLRPCAAFDRDRYIAGNADLGPWIERPLAHFLWIGRHHGLSSTRRARRLPDERVTVTPRHLPSPVSPDGLGRAVNIIGPLDRLGGVGVSARGYLAGLEAAGAGPVGARVQRRAFAAQSSTGEGTAFPGLIADAAINLVHMGPDTLPLLLNSPDGGVLAGRYNIAVWYWELPTLRPEWRDAMDLFHEFWAPSPFVARAISQLTAKPVRLVPPYLPYLARPRPERSFNPSPPHFVYCFDANSIVERKNPGLLLDAFLQAYPEESDARLTFKVTYPNRRLVELEHLYDAARRHPNVEVVDHLFSDAQLHRLIASATAYVSPHRSEGLGLTIVEAMALGTPVIATAFGGIAPFMTLDAAWPIEFRVVEIAEDHAPYPCGFVWADPDLESLSCQLRAVATNPQLAQERAAVARERVLANFASDAVIQTYQRELERAATIIGL